MGSSVRVAKRCLEGSLRIAGQDGFKTEGRQSIMILIRTCRTYPAALGYNAMAETGVSTV